MANRIAASGGGDINCVGKVHAWISHNSGTDWLKLPLVHKVTKTPNRETASQIKIEGVMTDVCSAASKSWEISVEIDYSKSEPIEWFLEDGDAVKLAVFNGDSHPATVVSAFDGSADGTMREVYDATFDDEGWDWDSRSTNPEARTLLFKLTSEAVLGGFPVSAVTAPAHPYANPNSTPA
jgi:hypothetical protein